jgi:hypothetical protein
MATKLPSVRALEELEQQYKRLIEDLYTNDSRQAKCTISESREAADKNAVLKVIAAVEALGLPYRFVHKSLCNIRDNYNDHNLRFSLEFDPKSSKTLAKPQGIIRDADLVRNKRLKRLETWKTKSLYLIANRKEIEIFEVDPVKG